MHATKEISSVEPDSGRNENLGRDLRVAIVDDVSLYTRKLMEGFREYGTECILYGPVSPPLTKSPGIMETMRSDDVRVWTQNLLALQVLKRCLRDKPNIVHIQFEFYGIHSFGPLYASFGVPVALLLLRLLRLKTVVTFHSVLPRGSQLRLIRNTSPSSRRVPSALVEAFLTLSYKTISGAANRVLVHAEVFRRRLVEHYNVDSLKVRVIPHGVEPVDPSDNLDAPGSRLEPSIILYFGVISPRKGLETLLLAFELLLKRRSNCELLLAGSSPPYYRPYETGVKQLVAKLGLASKVQFLGTVDAARAHRLFFHARFIVLPYAYDVSASGALSWALGHGLPVIASYTEYFREELSLSRFGLLVSPSDPRMLADAMETLLTKEDLRTRLSENARDLGSSRSWRAIAKATLGLYQDLL